MRKHRTNPHKATSRICVLCQTKRNIVHFSVMEDGNRRNECKKCVGIEAVDWAAFHKYKKQMSKPQKEAKKRIRREYYLSNKEKEVHTKKQIREMEHRAMAAKLMANLPLEELDVVYG